MPITACVIHRLDKASSDSPARFVPADGLHPDSEALDGLVTRLSDAYHGKSKRWGRLLDPGATPPAPTPSPDADTAPWEDDDDTGSSAAPTPSAFPGELKRYVDGELDLPTLSAALGQRLTGLIDDHLPLGGHLIWADLRQGDTRTLFLALVHHRDGFVIGHDHEVAISGQINHNQMALALRINLTQWQAGGAASQYLSMLADRGGKKLTDDLQALIGAMEGVDPKSETRTLLKAFSDYVESEDMAEDASREKTDALIDYATDQASRGESMTLDELSALVADDNPKAFYDHIRNADYGLSPEIPPDKRTLTQFRRFTGRAEGVSISFDSHLLGNSIEYDESQDRLIIKKLPNKLKEQLKGG
ncbi:nucleoid-associated protein [Halomonas sp. V046]|uniref:nucleoid-associated protein n=1 Tax=Halomonas sp. V046 TaxID=3459611 RepID=UPI0040444A15